MATFIPSVRRERHAFLETTQERLAAALTRLDAQKKLGTISVATLKTLNENLRVADFRHGVASLPLSLLDSEIIPVIAFKPEETVQQHALMAMPTPEQKNQIREQIYHWSDNQESYTRAKVAKSLRGFRKEVMDSPHKETMGNNISAGVIYSSYVEEVNHTRRLHAANMPSRFEMLGRPLVAVRITRDYSNVIMLGHELAHVHQTLQRPIYALNSERQAPIIRQRDGNKNELEAYHFGTEFGNALQEMGFLTKGEQAAHKLHKKVNDIRLQYTSPDDPYRPDDHMIATLREQQIPID